MKRLIKILLFVVAVAVLLGCSEPESNNLDIYLEEISIQREVSVDFWVPRILNGEGDHVITWVSSNEEKLTIGNIVTIAGLQYYMVEVNQDDENHKVKLTARVEMLDGSFAEKEFEIIVLEDQTIKEEKIRYVKEIVDGYNGILIRESIKLPRVTEKYGFELVWKSQNEDVISSSGEYKSPNNDVDVDFVVTILYNGVVFHEETITMHVINKVSVEKEVFLDFVSCFGIFAQSWDSSYVERSVSSDVFGTDVISEVIFSRADKQAGTITDRPVVATKASTEYIVISLVNQTFKKIEFSMTQWTTKTFDSIYIECFDGESWVKCSDIITVPGIISAEIDEININKVRLSFTSKTNKNVQMGLEYIKFEIN